MKRTFLVGLLLLTPGRTGGQEPPRLGVVRFETSRIDIPDESLLRAAGLRPGAPWTPEAEATAKKRLEALEFVDRVTAVEVRATPEGDVEVIFRLATHTLVDAVEIDGNDAILTSTLMEGMQTRPGRPLRDEEISADRELIVRKYHEDGFLFANVREKSRTLRKGHALVVFTVVEGYRVTIRDVQVEGNTALSENEIYRATGLRPERLFGVLERGYYRPHELRRGLSNLRGMYQSRGYLRAAVGLEDLDLDDSVKGLSITLLVEEGPRYVLDKVEIEGNNSFPPEILAAELDVEVGGFYDGEKLNAAAQKLRRFYQEHSDRVPLVVVAHRSPVADHVTVVFQIDEGRHRFVGRIDIEGNWKTRDRVIRSRMSLLPGQPLTEIALNDARARLLATRFFESVELTTEETDDPTVHNVRVKLKEKEFLGFLEVGGGASSGEGELGYFRVSQSNFDLFRLPWSLDDWSGAFRGGGQSLSVELIPGTRESEYSARFHEPWFFSSDRTLTIGGAGFILGRDSYDETRLRGTVEVRQFLDLPHRFSVAMGYRFEKVRIDDLDVPVPPDVLVARGSTYLGYPRLSARYEDLEINEFSGPKGLLAEARIDVGDDLTGSEVDFTRVFGSVDLFVPFFERVPETRHTLRVNVEAGWAESRNGDRFPFFERFFLGGPRSLGRLSRFRALRGFEYRGVGPHQLGDPVGGRALLRGSVEYSLPLFFPEVRAVALFDWGTLEPDIDRINTGRFRTAAGGGLQLRLKVPLLEQRVPVNLYWVEALANESGDERQFFTFTLGYGF